MNPPPFPRYYCVRCTSGKHFTILYQNDEFSTLKVIAVSIDYDGFADATGNKQFDQASFNAAFNAAKELVQHTLK